jgi:MFS family permease
MRPKPLILIALLLAAFVINLDTTIVNVALPTLVRELHASNSQLQWVVDAFNLLFAGSVLPWAASRTGSGARACCSPACWSSVWRAWPAG